MKKVYLSPNTECVNVKLFGSVMEEVPIGRPSQVGEWEGDKEYGDAKQFDSFDLWDAPAFDIWGEGEEQP